MNPRRGFPFCSKTTEGKRESAPNGTANGEYPPPPSSPTFNFSLKAVSRPGPLVSRVSPVSTAVFGIAQLGPDTKENR